MTPLKNVSALRRKRSEAIKGLVRIRSFETSAPLQPSVVTIRRRQQPQYAGECRETQAQRRAADSQQRQYDDTCDSKMHGAHETSFQESEFRKSQTGGKRYVITLAACQRGSLRGGELRCSEAAPEARHKLNGDGWRVLLDAPVKNPDVNIGYNMSVVKPDAIRVDHTALNADSNKTLTGPRRQELFSMNCKRALQSAFQLMYITYRQPVAECDSQVFKSIMDRSRQGLSVLFNDQGARWEPLPGGSALTAGARCRRAPLQPKLPPKLFHFLLEQDSPCSKNALRS